MIDRSGRDAVGVGDEQGIGSIGNTARPAQRGVGRGVRLGSKRLLSDYRARGLAGSKVRGKRCRSKEKERDKLHARIQWALSKFHFNSQL